MGIHEEEKAAMSYQPCVLCPRMCGVDRGVAAGFCAMDSRPKVARAALHHWEEPCISGIRGSGAVFFSGCTMRCCFCQNYEISSGGFGKTITVPKLADIFLRLQEQGAHNINLVTATQFIPSVLAALDQVRGRLAIPVVYNCGGYERPEMIKALKGYVDIFLPDFKYYDSRLSGLYSSTPDYFNVAAQAITQMVRQCGAPKFDGDGILQSGVIIRHMVLPGHWEDSIRLLHWMRGQLPDQEFLLSLLSQYTPFYKSGEYPGMNRRITTYEYQKVLDEAICLGLTKGYMQKKSSAREEYTPPFDLEGIDVGSQPESGH